jgi:hypothetical protein
MRSGWVLRIQVNPAGFYLEWESLSKRKLLKADSNSLITYRHAIHRQEHQGFSWAPLAIITLHNIASMVIPRLYW